jgi:hypothetical protein
MFARDQNAVRQIELGSVLAILRSAPRAPSSVDALEMFNRKQSKRTEMMSRKIASTLTNLRNVHPESGLMFEIETRFDGTWIPV